MTHHFPASSRMSRLPLQLAGLALCAVTSVGAALAQSYPDKPIRMIVPFPPGGATDPVARIVSQKLGEQLGQQVIVENLPGAGATIGLTQLARSAPDGYTIGLAPAGAMTVAISLLPNLPYDPRKDLSLITLMAMNPFVLVANPSVPANTPAELVQLAKANPGKLTLGDGGTGTSMHLSAELFKQMAGVDILSVPYKGNGPAIVDALGGSVDLALVDIIGSHSQIQSGNLKAIGVTSPERAFALPDTPTLAEGGAPGYASVGWFGMAAPAGVPAPILERLASELKLILEDPETQERIRAAGAEPWPSTPEAFAAVVNEEIPRWAEVIKTNNITLN